MRPSAVAVALLTTAGLAVATVATAGTPASAEHRGLTLAVYGDSPYGLSNTDTSQTALTPALIGSINADPDVSLVMHAGDIHSGKQFCTVDYDRTIASLWTGFADPLVYTPGDNEWSDCHKTGEGGGKLNPATGVIDFVPAGGFAQGNPADNLALVRSTFFSRPGATLGSGRLRVTSQAAAFDRRFPADRQFVENVRWKQQDVVFATVNIPGGSNNDTDTWYGTPAKSQAQLDDIAQRTAADLRWLDAAFRYARSERARAVVVMEQADMWDLDGNVASHIAEYEPFVADLAANTNAFGGPVLLINGDSHKYRSDNPYSLTAPCVTESAVGEVPCTENLGLHPGYDVPNFHRIVVHGSTSPLEWIKLSVSDERKPVPGANSFGPFSWTRVITGLIGNS
jgi:hypothetical protein